MVYWDPRTWFGSKAAERKASASKNAAKSDVAQAGESTSNAVNNAAHSVKEGTTAVGESASNTAHQVGNSATETTPKTRPAVKSHDSVGDKIRNAFKIDHKDHHKSVTEPIVESHPTTTV